MKIEFFKLENKMLAIVIAMLLVILTISTKYYGSTDIGDYADAAKYFSGLLSSKIRSSHSYLFGFIHAPLVSLTRDFLFFKITSLIFLFLIIASVYMISNKDKRALWMMLLSPLVWYMAPWISPIQLSALFFLWAFYYINKYDSENKIKYLAISGILIGLSWAVYDTILYFGFFLAICFLWNKKLKHSLYFLFFLIVGLLPRLILDQYLFNFPFYSIIKNFFGAVSNMWGGIYSRPSFHEPKTFATIISIILSIPIIFWRDYKPSIIKENKKIITFLSLSILLLFINPQIRYCMIIVPIIIVIISKNLNDNLFKKQVLFSLIIIMLFVFPYLIQINYSIDNSLTADFTYILEKRFKTNITKGSEYDALLQDIRNLVNDYPNETFVVGNNADDFQSLADIYWDKNVREFVSIEDYSLYLSNKSVLFEKKFMPVPMIRERRQIWISGGLNKNENDDTDYKKISLGIGLRDPIHIEGYEFIQKYGRLYLSKKLSEYPKSYSLIRKKVPKN